MNFRAHIAVKMRLHRPHSYVDSRACRSSKCAISGPAKPMRLHDVLVFESQCLKRSPVVLFPNYCQIYIFTTFCYYYNNLIKIIFAQFKFNISNTFVIFSLIVIHLTITAELYRPLGRLFQISCHNVVLFEKGIYKSVLANCGCLQIFRN